MHRQYILLTHIHNPNPYPYPNPNPNQESGNGNGQEQPKEKEEYEMLTVRQLKAKLTALDLDTTGLKATLLDRLRKWNSEQPTAEEGPVAPGTAEGANEVTYSVCSVLYAL